MILSLVNCSFTYIDAATYRLDAKIFYDAIHVGMAAVRTGFQEGSRCSSEFRSECWYPCWGNGPIRCEHKNIHFSLAHS